MIHVVLDTNIFSHDPSRSKPPFKALQKLIGANQIQLHVPHIVEREFQTQQRKNYSDSLSKAIGGLKGLAYRPLPLTLITDLKGAYEELETKKEELLNFAEAEFASWLDGLNVKRIPITIDHTNRTFEAYFSGSKPFKDLKNRKDLPDGFIVEGVRGVVKEQGYIHLVANDGGVGAAFDGNVEVEVHKDLEAFIASELIQETLTQVDILENLAMMFTAIKDLEEKNNRIAIAIKKDIGEQILWKTLYGPEIPGNDGQAMINTYGDVSNVVIDFGSLFYFGDGEFSVSFDLDMTISLNFYLDRTDYFSSVDEQPNLFSLIEYGDYSVEVEKDFQAKINGDVSMKLDMEKFEIDNLDEHAIKNIQIEEVQEITVS